MGHGAIASFYDLLPGGFAVLMLCGALLIDLKELPRNQNLAALGLVLWALIATVGDRIGLSMPQDDLCLDIFEAGLILGGCSP